MPLRTSNAARLCRRMLFSIIICSNCSSSSEPFPLRSTSSSIVLLLAPRVYHKLRRAASGGRGAAATNKKPPAARRPPVQGGPAPNSKRGGAEISAQETRTPEKVGEG